MGSISAIILVSLLLRYRGQLEKDLFGVRGEEHLTHVGIFLAVFSSIFFAFNSLVPGSILASLGIAIFVLGEFLERRPKRPQRWP